MGEPHEDHLVRTHNRQGQNVLQSWARFAIVRQTNPTWVTRFHAISPTRLGQVLEDGIIKPGPRQGSKRRCNPGCGTCAICTTPSVFTGKVLETCMYYASPAIFESPFSDAPVGVACILEVTQEVDFRAGSQTCHNKNYRTAEFYYVKAVWLRRWEFDAQLELSHKQMLAYEGFFLSSKPPAPGDRGTRIPLPEFLRPYLSDNWKQGIARSGRPHAFGRKAIEEETGLLSDLHTLLKGNPMEEVLDAVDEF